MSCKCNCKWCRWMPHNWLCLKGLYCIFITLFYVVFAYTLYAIYAISTEPMLSGTAYWSYLLNVLLNMLGVMLSLLTVAAILKALRKIVTEMSPCHCHDHETKEEVVVVSSQDK